MRGTKLMAWRVPPVWTDLQTAEKTVQPHNSTVLIAQKRLLTATRKTLLAVAADVRAGLLETVGVESSLQETEKCSMMLALPDKAETAALARAIDAENVEAWCDAQGQVHIGISPWYSTKDVDQTVLSAIKVIHVLLGLHASDSENVQTRTFSQKLLKAVSDVMLIQQNAARRKK